MDFLKHSGNIGRIERDRLFRKEARCNENLRYTLKNISLDESASLPSRKFATLSLHTMHRKGSFSLIRNRCVITGNSRSTTRRFRMSRATLRHMVAIGQVPQISKKSW